MAYQMKGNKKPGSSYKNGGPGEEFESKGLTGEVNNDDWWDGDPSKSTMLPEVEIGSDGSSKIHFDSSTDKGIETLYTGKREGEGAGAFTKTKRKKSFSEYMSSVPSKSKESKGTLSRLSDPLTNLPTLQMHERWSTPRERSPRTYDIDAPSQPQQKKDSPLSRLHKAGSDFMDALTGPSYSVTRKSGKEKMISKKRYDKLSAKLEKKKAKGKTPRRSVSDASMIERIMNKGKIKG